MTKRGQVGIGLVLLGIVAIIAVIGLVLLFTRASTEGASIGNIYGGGQNPEGYGIGTQSPVPAYSGGTYADRYAPEQQAPYAGQAYYTTSSTQGTRTPALVVAPIGRGGYASLDEASACVTDLHVGAHFLAPGDLFNRYQVPEETSSPEARGFFHGDSSAQNRITAGNPWGNIGGLTYFFANSVGAEGQVPNSEDLIRERIVLAIRANNGKLGYHDWGILQINGKEVATCYIGARPFPFDQGKDLA